MGFEKRAHLFQYLVLPTVWLPPMTIHSFSKEMNTLINLIIDVLPLKGAKILDLRTTCSLIHSISTMILVNIKSTSLKMENHIPAICKDTAIQKKKIAGAMGQLQN